MMFLACALMIGALIIPFPAFAGCSEQPGDIWTYALTDAQGASWHFHPSKSTAQKDGLISAAVKYTPGKQKIPDNNHHAAGEKMPVASVYRVMIWETDCGQGTFRILRVYHCGDDGKMLSDTGFDVTERVVPPQGSAPETVIRALCKKNQQ